MVSRFAGGRASCCSRSRRGRRAGCTSSWPAGWAWCSSPEGQEPHFIGVIRPGEPAGEMAMIAGTAHTATVMALRDSELMALPRQAFLHAIQRDPAVMAELAHPDDPARPAHRPGGGGVSEPAVFGFTALSPKVRARELVEALEMEIASLGYSVVSAGAEVQSAPHRMVLQSRGTARHRALRRRTRRDRLEGHRRAPGGPPVRHRPRPGCAAAGRSSSTPRRP